MDNINCTVGRGSHILAAKIMTKDPCYLGEFLLPNDVAPPSYVKKHSELLQLANTVRLIDATVVEHRFYHESLKRGTNPNILCTVDYVERFMYLNGFFVRGIKVQPTPSQVVRVAEQLAGLWHYLSVDGKLEGDPLIYYLFCGAKIMDDYWSKPVGEFPRSFVYGRHGPIPDLTTEVGRVACTLLERLQQKTTDYDG